MSVTYDNKKAKILLVEDEPNIAKLFAYNLKRAGYDYEVAENGQHGFEKAQQYLPDLIISDIMMPEVDGFEFRRMLLADPKLNQIPFIFLTAKGTEDDILEGYDLEIEDYIIKTSSAKVVLAKISAILASRVKERSRVVDEVKSAADNMGATVVPTEFPVFENFEIKHWHVPYQDVPGGDFIDYFSFNENRIGIILGDVMGKKWGAWYFAVAYAGYVRSAIRFAMQSKENITPKDILNYVNKAIFKDERISEVFITLTVVIIDRNEKKAYYSGAGDLPLLYKGDSVQQVKSGGLLLGFSENTEYEDVIVPLNKNDVLFLLSDGILDSRNPDGEAYGQERLKSIISEIKSFDDPLEFVKSNFTEYTGGKHDDDVSLISIKAF